MQSKEEYLRKERERKKKLRDKFLSMNDVRQEFIEAFPSINNHYLDRYLKLVYHKYDHTVKSEKHHILPKSLFPKYELTRSNYAKLPLKAHFLAHWMLVLMLPLNKEMQYAFYYMCNRKENFRIKSSRTYLKSKTTSVSNFKDIREERILNGTHNFCGDSNPIKKVVALGKHHSQTKEFKDLMSNVNKRRVALGTHHFANIKYWEHASATNITRNTWKKAAYIKQYMHDNPKHKNKKTYTHMIETFPDQKFSLHPITKMMKLFGTGWDPNQDPDWIAFSKIV